uniref:Regulator of telomere elongation helicase 1 n=1 Tax=Ascaris suum TaxID=6253 RepID=F1KUD6_ASCSU
MPTLQIGKISVEFPYEPYDCQLLYMEKVIETLKRSFNAALESPTGTGKTLCLLCATIAFTKEMKSRISVDATANPQGTTPGSLYPKIIYASRTHSQLAQVVRELNKTVYKDTKTATLASRDFLCINETVMKEQNSTTKALMCRNLVKNRKCRYYNEYDRQSKDSLEIIYNCNGMVPDIEDIVNIGKKHSVCPFYRTRSLVDEADLLLMPYNYVIDPRLRRMHDVGLKGNIVIFDEAHNLEAICEEAVSVSFSSKELSGCIRETKTVLEMIMNDEEEVRTKMDNTDAPFGASDDVVDRSEVHLEKNDVARLLAMLQSLEVVVDGLKKNGQGGRRLNMVEGKVHAGQKMVELLKTAGIRRDFRDELSLLVDRIGQYLVQKGSSDQGTVFADTGAHLQHFASFVSVVYADGYDPLAPFHEPKNSKAKRFNDQRLTNLMAEKFQLYVTEEGTLVTLNYWCFSPVVAMRYMHARGVRSIIVTSGTLSPLKAFIEVLGVDMRITLENDHVASSDQVIGACVYGDDNGLAICGSFKNRSSDAYLLGVGSVIRRICSIVPEGILVFFSSYVLMNTCIRKWKAHNVTGSSPWSEMAQSKKLFVEPKSKVELKLILAQFRESVHQDNGAALFAVCRAKVSEGIDFSDSESRAVVVVGVPFAPISDPRIQLKKQYLCERRVNDKNSTNMMSGEEWYQVDALRAVNQAIGRVLRHKDDFGAVVLVDSRFSAMGPKRFSSWMRNSLKTYKNVGEFEPLCAKFFKDHGLNPGKPASLVVSNSGNRNGEVKKRKMEADADMAQNSKFGIEAANRGHRLLDSLCEFDGLYEKTNNASLEVARQSTALKPVRERSGGILADIEELSSWKPKQLEARLQSEQSNFDILPTQPLPSGIAKKKIKLKPNCMASQSKSLTSKTVRSTSEVLESLKRTPTQLIELIQNVKDLEVRAQVNKTLVAYKKSKDFSLLLTKMSSVLLPQYSELFKALCSILSEEHQLLFLPECQRLRLI